MTEVNKKLGAKLDRRNMDEGDADAHSPGRRHFAHAKAGLAREQWHRLDEHLRSVASLAASFATRWGAAELGFLAGLWHDFGKYAPDWQEFLVEVGEQAPVLGEEDRKSVV